jgi:hypothetical protein
MLSDDFVSKDIMYLQCRRIASGNELLYRALSNIDVAEAHLLRVLLRQKGINRRLHMGLWIWRSRCPSLLMGLFASLMPKQISYCDLMGEAAQSCETERAGERIRTRALLVVHNTSCSTAERRKREAKNGVHLE